MKANHNQLFYHVDNDDLFAYFPDMVHNDIFMTAYSHIGQHSACHPDYAAESIPASPEQYKDLQNELSARGYNLEVL